MLQILTTFIFTTIIIVVVFYLNEMLSFGRSGLILPTFLYIVLLDQLKQVILLTAIYFTLVRRCFYLHENEEEHTSVEISES